MIAEYFFWIFLAALVLPAKAVAYFDPGTTGSVFTLISSFIPGIMMVLGFLFFPIKKLFQLIKDKFGKNTPEQKIKEK